MSDSFQRKELDAFFNYFGKFDLSQPVKSTLDLSDGLVLAELLSLVDPDYFHVPNKLSSSASEDWVLRFNSLKRLYRLMTQYFTDVLQKPPSKLEVPNLQAMAQDGDVAAVLAMCRMTIAIGVQCSNNKIFIERIQSLRDVDQHCLMKVIEQVMSRISTESTHTVDGQGTEDDHFYRLQSEKSQILSEKETLEKVYQALLEEHRTLQTQHDDAVAEKDEALSRLRDVMREKSVDSPRRLDKGDPVLRAEIDRLKTDLQKSEDNLAEAEGELEKQTHVITELTRRVDELQVQADEATKLKDQVDELRHAADKLQKTENVMEKYKKKLQEGADLRQTVKSLEKQNAELVDQNAALEEEYRKVAAFKPLMESYKNQIADLETKASSRVQELEALRFELEQSRIKLKITEDERQKDSEALELYQERVRELELQSNRPVNKAARKNSDGALLTPETLEEVVEERLSGQDLEGELDDAITGTTTTDLKLQIRKLKRELEAAHKNEADASRVLVLENLLEDSNRMKARYESDYLQAQREKLVLQRDLEEIRSGKSMGDGAEAALALRQRLNETVEQFETLRKEHAELEVRFESQNKELTIAKSDLHLVNKDQLDILASLRESVNEDKAALESDVERLRKQNKELTEKNRMQLEQVNGLLLEKINLQSEGISQREKMLLREKDFGDLRATLSGKDIPEDIKSRLLALHEENIVLKESNKSTQDKLQKARQFIKTQDKLFKEEQATKISSGSASIHESEANSGSQVKILEDEIDRYKRVIKEMELRYRMERELMFSAIHERGMQTLRNHHSQPQPVKVETTAWLNTQRKTYSPILRRS